MPVPATTSASIRGELLGLQTHLALATTGVVSKTTGLAIPAPVVRNRDYTGFYDGPWPLITIRYEVYRIDLISPGKPPNVGNASIAKCNYYNVTIEDVVPPNSLFGTEAVANSQDNLIDLVDAIVAYFNHLPNRCLPVVIAGVPTPMAQYAGVPMAFRGIPPFKEEEGDAIRVVLEGMIGVMSVAQTGLLA